jgi:hypothetical protein
LGNFIGAVFGIILLTVGIVLITRWKSIIV